ncbi:MAG TPA: helix-turn-helix domain containing protein [Candidatus Alistipes stercorigallinarum]|nr:helix-turn-helix domain containing protein [Candidatus Alistipes stercorigallinarum]
MSETIHDRIGLLVQEYGNGKNTVLADKLGVSEGNIRGYAKSVIPKADFLEKVVRTLDVNAMWLLTGIGGMKVSNTDVGTPILVSGNEQLKDIFAQLDVVVQKKDKQILEMAEEIGRLRERIDNLTKRRGENVSDAPNSSIASVG